MSSSQGVCITWVVYNKISNTFYLEAPFKSPKVTLQKNKSIMSCLLTLYYYLILYNKYSTVLFFAKKVFIIADK